MAISDTPRMIDVFTIALLMAEFGQVWAEYVCHDVTPQLWRRSEGKQSIQGDNCNKDVILDDVTPQLWHDVTPQLRLSERDGWWN